MQNRMLLGVVLIVVGIAGLLFVGGSGWGGGPAGGWGWYRAPWHRGPMMHGFGRHHMHGPWSWPGGSARVLPPVAGARTVEVAATEFSFRPSEIDVKAGEVVNLRLVNQGAAVHDITVPGLGIWIAAPVGQAVTAAIRADRPGTYEFFCSVPGHREAGMVGRIVVTP